jgi:hypothetical protein
MADPSGGSALPTSGAWVSAASATVGCVALSQPFIVIVDPIVSIALSVWIYGETFSATAARLAVGATAFATM